MPQSIEIKGTYDAKFERVKEVFADHFAKDMELGASVAVTIEGRPVVELWAGFADMEKTKPWQRDTLVNVYSTTKGITATCMHRLVDQGQLDLDQKVAHYWPEFAQNGKADITVRQLACHKAGLCAVDALLAPEALFDWETMVEAVAAQKSLWTPGTKHGYHARTFGWLLGEVVRRITGKSLGTYFKDELAEPLGLDFHIGLDPKHHGRVAFITPVPPAPEDAEPNLGKVMLTEPKSLTSRAFLNPPTFKIPDVSNTPQWRQAELPSSNGHATAAAIARLYGALACGGNVDGFKVLSKQSIAQARTQQTRGMDEVLLVETRFGNGFMLPTPGADYGPNDRAFGHPGMGGSLGFADPEAGIGFGYVMNLTGASILVNERPAALTKALYASL